LIVRVQVYRWGQGRKTAKQWQIWTLRINCIWQGRALFDTGDSDVHQHVLYQIRPHSTLCDVESLSYDPKTMCQTVKNDKNDSKKWKSANRAFKGRFLTFWVNMIRRIRILQKFWHLDNVYPRYGPSKLKNVQKCEKMDQKSKFDFFVFLGNFTMENTNFNSVLMILWSISEIRVPENAKSTKINRKWSKN
jgi:hypothetical protein